MPDPSAHLSGATIAAVALEGRSLIRSLQEPTGAYPASPTFSAYRGYSWFRDGSFIADGMSAGGDPASAEAFFDWCAKVIRARRDAIARVVEGERNGSPVAPGEMLGARFTFDGSDGTEEWWDFQLDGYGTWLWALGEHVRRHGVDPARWLGAVALTVDYLASSWRRSCFDWWEMHEDEVHVSTIGCIVAGLRAAGALTGLPETVAACARDAAEDAEEFIRTHGTANGHLVKWVGTDAVDASAAALVGLMSLFPAGDPLVETTVRALDEQLVVDGGMHRFLDDTYFGGGQWPLLGCMLGVAWARLGNTERARELLRWAVSTAHDGGMPEQVERHLLDPSFVDEWVQRWGTSADPLLWSSAMTLRLAVELGEVRL